LLRLTVSNPT